MDQPESDTQQAPIISLTDAVGTAVQLVPRFGYDEAERIMLESIEHDDRIDRVARRHVA